MKLDDETKKHIGNAGYVTDDQLKKFEDGDLSDEQIAEIERKSGIPKEKIDEAEKLQEVETEKYKRHIFEYERYNDLSQVVRHLLGALVQLNKYKDKKRVDYWASVVNHWRTQVGKVIANTELFEPPLTKQLIDDLDRNIERLRKLKPEQVRDLPLLVDDIKYRLGAVYASLVSLEGIKQYAIEKRHSDLIEYIQNRITVLEAGQLNPTALDTMESLTNDKAVLIELKGLIYHDNLTTNNDERSK